MAATDSPAVSRTRPRPVDWARVRRVHLMGICGSAMGALAMMLRDRGYEVRGSDAAPYPPMSDRLADAGITVMRGYDASNLDWGPEAVVIGNVMRPDYPEVLRMRERDLPGTSMSEALRDVFLARNTPIVVSGTHGKTTTSSMTARLLHGGGLAPSFFIGGQVPPWQRAYHLSEESRPHPFVVEGDEYDTAFFDKDSKFHHYAPKLAAINNIEFDHADIFKDLDAIIDTFARFARRVPSDGLIVAPAEDPNVARALGAGVSASIWRTALHLPGQAPSAGAEVFADRIRATDTGTSFELHLPGAAPTPASLAAPGLHNLRNALVASALAYRLGLSAEGIAEGLAAFTLPLRRLTLVDTVADIPILDDFAHHPTAIAATLDALRQRYPDRRLVALFEVQSNTARRRVFQEAFGAALARADRVFFGRPLTKGSDPLPPEERLDLPALAAAVTRAGAPATIVTDTEALARQVADESRPGEDVIVAMSGRDFDGVHGRIARQLRGEAPAD